MLGVERIDKGDDLVYECADKSIGQLGGEAELQAAERPPMEIEEEAVLTIGYRDLPAILDCYLNYITM